MRRKLKLIILFAIAVVAAGTLRAYALEVPKLTARVNDYAGMISSQAKSDLETKLYQLEKSDSTQIFILTIPSLEGDALEDFSIHVFDKWKIGRKKLDNGVMLLISKNDRKVRIEVGYGLEGKLTDLISGQIIDNIITPAFKSGDYDKGIIEGTDALISVVRGEYKAGESGSGFPEVRSVSKTGFYFILFLLVIIGIAGSIKKIAGGFLGAAVFPIAGLFLLPASLWILLLIPIGFLGGLILPFILSIVLSGIGSGGGVSSSSSSGGFGEDGHDRQHPSVSGNFVGAGTGGSGSGIGHDIP